MQPKPFSRRHIGPDQRQIDKMLSVLGLKTLDQLIDQTIPKAIRAGKPLPIGDALSEHEATSRLRKLASKNKLYRSYIGCGYHNTIVPSVIQRNILENPGWYTQYTPYQAEISQGRLEALLNFQTMIADLTGLPLSNASLLDEATAAAEAMYMCFSSRSEQTSSVFFVSSGCHPQTLSVVQTRAEPLGIEVVTGDLERVSFEDAPFGILIQYPDTYGEIKDLTSFIERAHRAGSLVVTTSDVMSLVALKSPGALGADIAVGSTQRFGVPVGFGGPHAAFLATKNELSRKIPGRIIGVSKDASGAPALRMALQTREQHIRRDKATSNICTSQVLLAIMSSMYAVYHGPDGLQAIANGIHSNTLRLADCLKKAGHKIETKVFFDTLVVKPGAVGAEKVAKNCADLKINLRHLPDGRFGISLDETVSDIDLRDIAAAFGATFDPQAPVSASPLTASVRREDPILTHPVFNSHHSETQMLRYIRSLESKDLSLTRSMIPLGSCTMKLNATSELLPVSWPEWNSLHPFAPADQVAGYHEMIGELGKLLAACTGFSDVSLQPNSGAQGEYAGLLAIRRHHQSMGQGHRDVCLIPKSAHGTNPASAVLAGMKVAVVECDSSGNIDVQDLRDKAAQHATNLAALMVTYPSTHGVFEEEIREICTIVHKSGGQVYMDGANMNAQLGLCMPGEFGPDVCHLNLHKTFCIPHGGGGPGVGPIAVKPHLAKFLPGHSLSVGPGIAGGGAVSAAAWGSASILPISLMYIWMMGSRGLTEATRVAILNANYLAKRLHPHFPVLYRGKAGFVAHECIVDIRPLKATAGIEVEDIAKRLMDYGFHAPTISFPVPGTMMIEPTESEDLAELDRFCDALISIRAEIAEIESGKYDRQNNPLKNAPHTAEDLTREDWNKPYSRAQAVFPLPWVKASKFWPSVKRIDAAYGDRNLVCTCPSPEEYR